VKRVLVALAALLCAAASAGAPPPDALKDPAQEAHAHQLFRQVRCLVCQNESIDDSEAPLAADLRRLIRVQVAEGRSDSDVRAFLVRRYGEFVLLKPAFSPANALLWLTPFVIVLGGGAALAWRSRGGPALARDEALSPAEEARLAALTRREGVA
jgi:cytochrome c-type biogenesis protein CcmH